MADTRGTSPGRQVDGTDDRFELGLDPDDWSEPEPEPRDWKKIVLVIGLGTLSWVATYIGMLELIQANMGDLPLTYKAVIGFSVAMLMIMIIWLLDQLFSPIHFSTKVAYVGGYIFLTLISVGFGFGFYWKVLESRSEATRSAESAVGQVQIALHAGSTRMEQLNVTLTQLTALSSQKAIEEREKGTSCPNSSPGDGPRRKLRDDDAQRFSFAADFVSGRIGQVKQDLTALDTDMAKITTDDQSTIDTATGTRNEFMRGLNRRLDMTVAGFNAFRTDPQLRQIRADLADRAEKTIFPTSKGGTFSCPDPQLQAALRGVVRAIDQLPELSKPQIAAVEGSEATIEAFRRLTASLQGAIVFDLPPSADQLRELQKKAVRSVDASGAPPAAAAMQAGLSKRDYIPLAIAIFVDLCLLLVSIGRPMNRLNTLVPKMREAERGPVIRILSRFNEIHRDPEIRQNFEVFRHVVFDYHGAYYVAVPLDTPYNRVDPRNGGSAYYGASDAQDLQHEAHLLANLFSSFERERIFARVHSPLLTTRMIQKRLARQGSKFAGSQAFRIYRFKEGAWSDIILGAVMGAARRVEKEKLRRRRLEEAQAASHGPVLHAPQSVPTTRPEATEAPARPPYPAEKFDGRWPDEMDDRLDWPNLDASVSAAAVAARSANRKNGAHANGHAAENGVANGNGNGHHHHALDGIDVETTRRPAAADNDRDVEDFDDEDGFYAEPEADESFQSQFGSYASAAKAELKGKRARNGRHASAVESDHEIAPANNNTAPVALPNEVKPEADAEELPEAPENVIVLPAAPAPKKPEAAEQTTVTMTRETATFTVPSSEATDPRKLLQAARSGQAVAVEMPAADLVEKPTQEAVLPVLRAPVAVGQNAEPVNASAEEVVEVVEEFHDADDDFDALSIFHEDDEEATRTIANRLKPARHS